ncbi:TetR/AcrR family transcriptional regulator [Actinoalloteichus caeruleus]|uniref:TetR/AcrR family transcriptional regulator n=1 Tax=Actinoalloteichus cyanogriseus TaxID=2893586 RepID=UPI0004AA763C|nr:TetR/AcrR family transcriptional regulator [Actinoalloteichus caeruleus]
MTEAGDQVVETGVRTRTRQAILDAAVVVLSRDSSASLSEVAREAGVGRTTLHRYFAERSDLVHAIGTLTLERIAVATDRAKLEVGPAREAIVRLCREYFELLGDVLSLVFTDPQFSSGLDWHEESDSDLALLALVQRGHRDGSIDRELTPEWVQQALWALLYAAWAFVRECGVSRHEALGQCLRSLDRMLHPVGERAR